jgi:hypothetical protein
VTESVCPECGTKRDDFNTVCPACGAPPGPRREGAVEGVRTTDLEPYITLRYIAKLFKVLAVLIALMMVMEIITGLLIDGRSAIMTLLGESTRLLVMAGLLWAGGDITLLLIDAGHDVRVVRILLGRINAEVHRTGSVTAPAPGEKAEPPRAASR